jgi:molybdopterin-guanine dinucleotide biosynthesis protein A
VANHRLTGVLLVGGASSRFGSPKALARTGSETFAQRGYRVLAEACDEVLAVGKLADGLPLPFPLLDDGTADRAPVFGVMAALRTASADVCVVVPVDCVTITPAVVRALGAAVAVPQTGPLPGAYSKALLPLLEARVERGELSLRGVNGNVLHVDETLLRDVDRPEDLDLAALDDDRPA